jgi:putative oxidoreductase
MSPTLQGALTLAGRLLLCTIFLVTALVTNLFEFTGTINSMEEHHVPAPQLLLIGAVVFLVLGSVSVMAGWYTRVGAVLLIVFLVAATLVFHRFWEMPSSQAQNQLMHFLKNVSMLGGLLYLLANGPGPWSIDNRYPELAPAAHLPHFAHHAHAPASPGAAPGAGPGQPAQMSSN